MEQQLTPEQSSAVECSPDDHCIVRAGPGSGKTFFLVQRVLELLRTRAGSKIYCFSFTNESSRELKRRLAGFGVIGMRVQASTIHKFCLVGLSCNGERLKVIKNKQVLIQRLRRVVTDSERMKLIGEGASFRAQADLDQDDQSDESDKENVATDPMPLEAISESERSFLSHLLDDIRSLNKSPAYHASLSPTMRTVAARYKADLAKEGVIDLSMIVSEFLAQFDSLSDYIESVGEFLFVDEFQDLDPEQLLLVQRLIEVGKKLTAVGDVNQSIYGWRQEGKRVRIHTPSNSNHQMFCFNLNLRCCETIVRTSNLLIDAHNTATRGGGFVKILRCRNETEELLRIAKLAKSIDEELCSFAVLFRLNGDKERFTKILDQQNIPFHGKHVGHSTDVKRTKAMETLLIQIEAVVQKNPQSTIEGLVLYVQAKKSISQRLGTFVAGVNSAEELRVLAASKSSDIQCKSVIAEYLGKLSKINRQSSLCAQLSTILSEFKIQKTKDVNEFIRSASSCLSLNELLDSLSRKEREEVMARNSAKGLYVGTIHSAKGREWKTVVIPLVNEFVLPSDRCDVDEERRVLYVGLTRARDAVIITCSKPSPFVSELHMSQTGNIDEVIHGLKGSVTH